MLTRRCEKRRCSLWTRYEKRLSRLHVTEADLATELADPDYIRAHSRIENWYFRHNGFIDGDALLKRSGGASGGRAAGDHRRTL